MHPDPPDPSPPTGRRWSGVSEAYRHSFASLCEGTVGVLLADTAEPASRAGNRRDGLDHLDVGCGTGVLARRAAEEGRRVVALDSDPDMIALSRETTRGQVVAVARGALPALELAADGFDVVTANFVVNHLPDPRAGVRELARVVRPGGLVALTGWTNQADARARLFADSLAAAGAVTVPGQRLPAHLDYERSAAGLAGLATRAGLRPVVERELALDWDVAWDALWRGISGGVGGIGETYLSQTPEVQQRIEAEMRERARAHETDVEGSRVLRLSGRAAYVLAEA